MLRGVFISAAIVVAVLVNSTLAYAQSFLNGDWVGAFTRISPSADLDLSSATTLGFRSMRRVVSTQTVGTPLV